MTVILQASGNRARKQKECQMKRPDSSQIKELLTAGVSEPAQALFLDSEVVSLSLCGTRVTCSAFNFTSQF